MPCSFSFLLDVIKLSCKSKIKGLSAGHKALTVDTFSVVRISKTEGGGWKGGRELYALNLFIKSIEGISSLPDIPL